MFAEGVVVIRRIVFWIDGIFLVGSARPQYQSCVRARACLSRTRTRVRVCLCVRRYLCACVIVWMRACVRRSACVGVHVYVCQELYI